MPDSCCVVGCTNRIVKETTLSFYPTPSGTNAFEKKREEKTDWGKLIVKIGTMKMNSHTKGFWNKEFVEHTFCQVNLLCCIFLSFLGNSFVHPGCS